MDNLKKYLQQHLDELDSDLPADAVWQKIQQTQTPALPKKSISRKLWQYAAAACVLAGIAAAFLLVNNREKGSSIASRENTGTNQVKEMIARHPLPKSDTLQNIPTAPATEIVHSQQPLPQKVYAKKERSKKTIPSEIKKALAEDPMQAVIRDVEHNYAILVDRQLEHLRITPVYAESPDYFSIFKQQYKQIEKDESAIKRDIQQHGLTDELLQQLININQQKLNVLKALQAEVSKLNNKVKQSRPATDSSQSFYLTM